MAEKEKKKRRKDVKPLPQKEDEVVNDDGVSIDSPKVSSQVEPVYIGVKDNYLPHALVKIKLCENNAEARKYIRSEGVILNGNLTHDTDATNESNNFELNIKGDVYLIFLL